MNTAFKNLLKKHPVAPLFSILLGTGFEIIDSSNRNLLGRINYEEAGFKPRNSVNGHRYIISLYLFNNKPVLVFHGRLHLYEGYSQSETIFPIAAAVQSGAGRILITTASGGLTDSISVGDIVRVVDHINLTGSNPIYDLNLKGEDERFLDLANVYKNSFSENVRAALMDAGLNTKDGVLAAMLGPIYETPAEALFLKNIGADVVSMSVAAEAIFAHYSGIETAAIAGVSNHHFKDTGRLSHQEILKKINSLNTGLNRFLDRLLPKL